MRSFLFSILAVVLGLALYYVVAKKTVEKLPQVG